MGKYAIKICNQYLKDIKPKKYYDLDYKDDYELILVNHPVYFTLMGLKAYTFMLVQKILWNNFNPDDIKVEIKKEKIC